MANGEQQSTKTHFLISPGTAECLRSSVRLRAMCVYMGVQKFVDTLSPFETSVISTLTFLQEHSPLGRLYIEAQEVSHICKTISCSPPKY